MIVEVKYTGLEDRKQKIAEQESKGLRMLHDHFVAGWEHGDELKGTLIFTDELPEPFTPEPPRDLAAEVEELETNYGELNARVKDLEDDKDEPAG